MNVNQEAAKLRTLPVDELQKRYRSLFSRENAPSHRDFLIRRIIWGMQAKEYGGLSEAALRRAQEIARTSGTRIRRPHIQSLGPAMPVPGRTVRCPVRGLRDSRLPMPGAVLTREYQGKRLTVTVLDEGFEYEGKVYSSLTALTKEITGAHWNGLNFFGLGPKRRRS